MSFLCSFRLYDCLYVIHFHTGTLYDRPHPPGRRPLVPKQSHLDDGGGSYVVRNTAVTKSSSSSWSVSRPHSTMSHPHSKASSQFHSNPSFQSHSNSASLIFKTPHRPPNFVPSNSFTPSPSPVHQYPSHPSQPVSISANSNHESLLATPRRTVLPPSGPQRTCFSTSKPVWKGVITEASVSDNYSHQILSTAKPPDQQQLGQGSNHARGSFACDYNQPKTDWGDGTPQQALSANDTTVKHCVRTSTQLSEVGHTQGEVEHDFDGALSPLQITLSQMCAMEDSLVVDNEGEAKMAEGCEATIKLTCEASTVKSSSTAAIEDSGYVSREVSTFQSPSPHAKDNIDPSIITNIQEKSDMSEIPKVVKGVSGVIDEDTLLAEAALEGLNDSLEDMEDIVDDDKLESMWSQKHSQQKNGQDNQSSHSSSTTPHGGKTRTMHHSGVVRPQMGTLLSTRLNNARIHLEHAVRYRPPGGFTLTQLYSLGVSENTVLVRAANAINFSFPGEQYFSSAILSGGSVCIGDGALLNLSSTGRAGVTEFWEAFRTMQCVDEKLISYEWFVNHYKQLVWKLASMEVCYPRLFGGRCLTPDWLMLQLKYRYDREIDQAERSALHKICESDDVPSKRMVLCVSKIYKERVTPTLSDVIGSSHRESTGTESGNETVIQSENSKDSNSDATNTNPPCMEVTDGWYSLPCVVDNPLRQMIKSGKVVVGMKLLVYGAELVGWSNPTHPLEVSPSCCLKISANSTRRARWYAKLGYQPTPRPFPIPLMSSFPDGGLVGCTDVVIARVYPLAYLEKREGEKSVLRSERLELKIATLRETERQRKIDAICSRVQKQFEEDMAKEGKSLVFLGLSVKS